MRRLHRLFLSFAAAGTTGLMCQVQVESQTPTFDVVSIRRNTGGAPGSAIQRPDGGFTLSNSPVSVLISRAYPGIDSTGLPDWARSERYDISATSSVPRTTPEDRAAMVRAMLSDRFKLIARVEKREQPVYDLVLARSDGALGSGLRLADESVDCEERAAAERARAEAAVAAGQPAPSRSFPDLSGPPPPCTIFTPSFGLEGNVTMTVLASFLRATAGRPVVDRTGLRGMYYVRLEYDRLARIRGPAVNDSPAPSPSVFSALPDQLGLKLEPSSAIREMVVIENLERPTEN